MVEHGAIALCMSGTILSILMLAGIAMLLGGLHALIRKRDTKRGWLMLILAAVMFGNVAISTVQIGPKDTPATLQ